MTINPYQVSIRHSGFFSIDIYDGDRFLDIAISNIKPHKFAIRLAKELNIAFNDGLQVGKQNADYD